MAKVYYIRENVSYFGTDGKEVRIMNETMYQDEKKANSDLMNHLEKMENDGWHPFFSNKTEHNIMIDSEANVRVEYSIESYTLL